MTTESVNLSEEVDIDFFYDVDDPKVVLDLLVDTPYYIASDELNKEQAVKIIAGLQKVFKLNE